MTEFFTNPIYLNALIGVLLVALPCAICGCFLHIQNNSLFGETIAHGCLPGVYFGFLFSESRHVLWLTLGAALTGIASSLIVTFVLQRTRLKRDAALAAVLGGMYGVGIALLSWIQSAELPNQNGLESVFLGNAAALTASDLKVIGTLGVLALGFIALRYRSLVASSFDRSHALISGHRPHVQQLLLYALVSICVSIGIQSVGALLVAALIIVPAAIARMFTHSLLTMMAMAAIFSSIAGWLGTSASAMLPNLPTGPCVVLALTGLFMVVALVKVLNSKMRLL